MSVTLVGILNVTTDSFSTVGRYIEPAEAIVHVRQLFKDGAGTVDIGAEATNPYVKELLSVDEEWQRLEPILSTLLPAYASLSFSIDTRHAEIVERAAALAGDKKFYVNDVTTFVDPNMIEVTARHGLWAICSHLPLAAQGDIARAHSDSSIRVEIIQQVVDELRSQEALMIAGGIPKDHIIKDPGIGFGKTMQLNYRLLSFANRFPGEPVMIAASQKRFLEISPNGEPIKNIEPGVYKLQDIPNQQAAKIAIESGASYLRVHKPEIYADLFTIN